MHVRLLHPKIRRWRRGEGGGRALLQLLRPARRRGELKKDDATADAATAGEGVLERDDFSSNRHPALPYCWSMIFSENRFPLFGIMLWANSTWRKTRHAGSSGRLP